MSNHHHNLRWLGYLLVLLVIAIIGYELVAENRQISRHIRGIFRGFKEEETETSATAEADFVVRRPKPIRSVVVRTRYGRLRGYLQDTPLGVPVQAFLAVPYGQPPVAALRFRKTRLVRPWRGTRDATRMPPPCQQPAYTQLLFPVHILNTNVTEDCLFLNVWVPVGGAANKTVMVYVHGGLFTIGSIGLDEYDGATLAAAGDVIVVSIQYRLGLFGFLDMDHPDIPGNMGLYDQYTAMLWIRQNIRYFGGNPDSVTLFGTSAGAMSIGLHMFSSMASPLFRRAILQSGSPFVLKTSYERGEELAERFVTLIGCWNHTDSGSIYDDPEPVVRCIDRTPLDAILQAQDMMVKGNPVPFFPTIPSEYIEQFLTDLNDTTRVHQTELLVGFNQNEGALILHLAYPQHYTRNRVPAHTRIEEVHEYVGQIGRESGMKANAAANIASLLIRGAAVDQPERWAQKVADLMSDVIFVCPIYQLIDRIATFNQSTGIYLYMFSQRAKSSPWGDWMEVTHHDEMNFVMGYPVRYPEWYSVDDQTVSRLVMSTWTHFAKTGKIPDDLFPERWPTTTVGDQKPYMHIKAGEMQVRRGFHNDTCELFSLMSDYLQ